jgi:hypothetical protein
MDLFAGTVNRENTGGILWVCDRCFKYMADGTSWEVHMVCMVYFPITQRTEDGRVDVLIPRGRGRAEKVHAQTPAW